MTTAVIGIGAIGGTVARQLTSSGEPVAVAARDLSDAARFASDLGRLARAGSVDEVIADADAVVLAVMWQAATNLVPEYANLLADKVVIDPSHPLAIDEKGMPLQRNGMFVRNLPEGISSGALIAGLLPGGARYVKAFGSLTAADLASGAGRSPERAALLYATDDDQAASTVERLISVAGFDPVKIGGVADTRRIEFPGGDLHQYGAAFQGRPPTAAEVRAAVDPTK
jgi:8-hydroxy-5-deazaflavin:NADPH oxidoreductase